MPEFLIALVIVLIGWRLWRLYRAHKLHKAWLADMRRLQAEFQKAKERHSELLKARRRHG